MHCNNKKMMARFRRRSTHVPTTDELSTAKERRLNQFGAAKALSSTESVELLSNFTWVRHTVRRLNQMSRQCGSKVELIQLGLAHEKYGV